MSPAIPAVAEADAHRDDRHFPQLFAALAAAVYSCDAEGRVRLFNKAAVDLWGRTPAVGKDLWCGSWKIFTPDGDPVPLDSCPMAVALHEGHSVRGVEIVVERPDGSRRNVLPHPDPIRDETGQIVGAVNLLVDITEHKRADRARALLAAIVDSSDDAIVSKTLEGYVTSWNKGAERIFGYTQAEMIGRHITTLIPDDRLPEEDEILSRLRRGQRIDHFQTIRKTKDGRLLHISLTVSPVRDSSGRLIGASKVARDITIEVAAREALQNHRIALEEAVARRTAELEESHQRLRLSERMAGLGTLSAGLGHDMGNLLLPVRISIETLLGAGLPQDLASEVQRIATSAQYLQQLANGLRMMALDPGRTGPAEPLNLREWWADAQAIIRNALPRNVTLDAHLHPDAWARVSRPAITQAVFNLAQNAGEALRTQENARVEIRAIADTARCTLSVSDNGPGMSEEVRARCLEPFFTTKTRAISTGLGLVLVAGIVKEAGGTIEVQSQPGRGATFLLRFPDARPAADTSRPRFALVDLKDRRMRSVVAAELRQLSFEVLADARAQDIDLAVTDQPDASRFRARQVVRFADPPGRTDNVHSIGVRPKPDAIRRVLRSAACAEQPLQPPR